SSLHRPCDSRLGHLRRRAAAGDAHPDAAGDLGFCFCHPGRAQRRQRAPQRLRAAAGGAPARLWLRSRPTSAGSWICLEPDRQLALRWKARRAPCAIRSTARVVVGSLRAFSERAAFDTILDIDVLEHIREDRAQVETAAALVRPGGYIVILSPAHHWLYSEFDRSIGHVRRYAKSELR